MGLDRLHALLEKILDGRGTTDDLRAVRRSAAAIYDSADCAIGFEAARLVLDGLEAFRDDYLSHIENGVCTAAFDAGVPCVAGCPANVDVPGYIALIREERYADAVRLIRKDNPFPGVCGLICEHPCEKRLPPSDRGRFHQHPRAEALRGSSARASSPRRRARRSTAKRSPSSAADRRALRRRTISSSRAITSRCLKSTSGSAACCVTASRATVCRTNDLDRDINAILSTGIQVKLDVDIGREITFDQIRSEYDSVYIAIGAQIVNRMNIPGQDSEGVLSAVELLGAVGAGEAPDFTGTLVVVVGGGNVAMDATRTAKRLGAASVTCVYRRRIEDMTAAREEIDGAIAEGCEIMPMLSPVRIETEDDRAVGIAVQPQLSGPIENGRPKPINADQPEIILPADVVITAIGQAIDSAHFESSGVGTERRRIKADPSGAVPGMPGVFTGGDCFFGPSTVVRAIDSGKVVAGNIDHYFGFHTPITSGVDIPPAQTIGKPAWGRVNMRERTAGDRKEDFNLMEAVPYG